MVEIKKQDSNNTDLKINALICNIGLLREKVLICEVKDRNSTECQKYKKQLYEKEEEYNKLMKLKNSIF